MTVLLLALLALWPTLFVVGLFMHGATKKDEWLVIGIFWTAMLFMLPLIAVYLAGERLGHKS